MPQADLEVVSRCEIHRPNAVEAREVLRIIDGDNENARPALDRRAGVLLPHFRGDAFPEILRDGLHTVVVEELRAVKLRERLAHLVLRHVVVFDEDLLYRDVVHARAADGLLDVFFGNDSFVDERTELRRLRLASRAMLVVKRDPQDPRNLLGSILILSGEDRSVTLVNQLQNTEEVFLEGDRDRKYGSRPEAALFVPTLIESQIRMVLRQLRRIVSIFNVDRLARERRKSGDRSERFRNANFFGNVADLLNRIQLLIFGVDGVNRQAFRVEELEDLVLEREQDVRDRLGGIELIGDRRQFLAVFELALDRRGGSLDGHAWSPIVGKNNIFRRQASGVRRQPR